MGELYSLIKEHLILQFTTFADTWFYWTAMIGNLNQVQSVQEEDKYTELTKAAVN